MKSIFIKNVNTYINEMHLKLSYISLKTGIEEDLLYSILEDKKDPDNIQMEKIAKSLGNDIEYFLTEDFQVPNLASILEAIEADNKKKYTITFVAEEVDSVLVEMTEEEYEIVNRVLSEANSQAQGFCGSVYVEPYD